MDYSENAYDAFSGTASQDDREPCDNCGRRFNPDALDRHIPICSKQKKRKTFNTAKQRAEGTELAQFNPAAAKKTASNKIVPAKKSNWRAKHEDFINTIRAARQVTVAQENGLPLPPPPPPSINPDYIQCDYCQRRFSQQAAERHINFCKEKNSRLPSKKPDASAAAKQVARLQYKAPRLKGGNTAPNSLAVNNSNSPGYGNRSMKSPQSPSSPAGSAGMAKKRGGLSAKSPASNRQQYSVVPDIGEGASGGISPGSKPVYSPNKYSSNGRYGIESPDRPDSGPPLRTGRTAETYSEARQLSSNQRSNLTRTRGGFSGSKMQSPGQRRGLNNQESGYSSNASDDYVSPKSQGRVGSASRFCYECGTGYPIATAKFCCECGTKRLNIS